MIAIVIHTNADFTPAGKRRVRVVRHKKNGQKCAASIRWYVGAKAYRTLALTNENISLSADWKTAR